MKKLTTLLLMLTLMSVASWADETITVSANSTDISEGLDLKVVAKLFAEAENLEQFEMKLNNPDSAFCNLDLNGDGQVDYLRVIETGEGNKRLIVLQAILAKDIYQDVASIYVEKDEAEQVSVQVIGDEYIYGADYIIEPVYIYRPMIYDWFWGPSWVCWHSPFYWDYWPTWWHPYHCIAHHLYWDHIYWHHHYYPICTYRTGHHYHPHYAPMRERVSRTDYATRHPERSFATRNASRNYSNARSFDRNRQTAVRSASRVGTDNGASATRVSTRSTGTASRTFGSSNVRTASGRGDNTATRGTATRATSVSRGTSASRSNTVSTATRSASTRTSSSTVATPTRSASTATRSTAPSVNRSSSSSSMRSSSSSSSMRSSSSSAVRSSSSSSSMRSSGGGYSSGGSMRSSGGVSSSRGGGGGTRR